MSAIYSFLPDVQAANILIDGNGHVVLADFSICAALEVNKSEQKAPEMKRPSLPHRFKV